MITSQLIFSTPYVDSIPRNMPSGTTHTTQTPTKCLLTTVFTFLVILMPISVKRVIVIDAMRVKILIYYTPRNWQSYGFCRPPRPNYNLVYQKFVYSFKVMISTVITLRNHCTVTSVADCYPTKLSSKLPKINGVDFVKKRENILTVKIADHYKREIDQKNKECPEHPSQAASLARGS